MTAQPNKISDAGLFLIKSFEGCRLKSYRCLAGVWTIGWGHTKGVLPGQEITAHKAETLLLEDLAQFEQGVATLVKQPLSQGQFDALVSFAFNLGLGALRNSTLLRKLNKGDYAGAAAEFTKWNKAGGKEVSGLTRRRVAEQGMFLGK